MIEPDLPRRLRDLAHAPLDAAAAETVRLQLYLTVAHHPRARAGTAPGAAILLHLHRLARAALGALIASTKDLPPLPTTPEISALMIGRIATVVTAAAGAVTAEASALTEIISVAALLIGTSRRRGVGTRRQLSRRLLLRQNAEIQSLLTFPCMRQHQTRLVNNSCGWRDY